MRASIISLFPESLEGYCSTSIVSRAQRAGKLELNFVDPRRWAGGRHRVVDDRPYGGGPGMVLGVPPIARTVDALKAQGPMRLLMTSPQGRRLDQPYLQELSEERHIVVVCGHYEGIDERFVDLYQPEEFSIGDFVLSGGELASLVLIDGIARLLPGVLGHELSAVEDSFSNEGLLDHPCYTRPERI